jgi:hypothetical protein
MKEPCIFLLPDFVNIFVLGEDREGGGLILRQIFGRQVVRFVK